MKRFLLLASFAALSTFSLQAQVFTDTFESYSAPSGGLTSVATPNAFGSWNVTAGSIEILNSYAGLDCHSGTHCIDMDGATNSAGTITRSFAVTAGTQYTLTYWFRGNERSGSDSMTVSIGSTSITHTAIPSTQGYTLQTLVWTAPTTGTGTVTFAHAGGDNIGILLDDVTVSGPVGTPTLSEWGMLSLAAMLVMFGAYKVKVRATA